MKRKKQVSDNPGLSEKFARLPAAGKRRLLIKSAVTLGVLGVAAGAISGYDSQQRELHDLSIIGAGKPVVVQIHDTSCPDCRRLKSRALKVLEKQPDVRFRLADVSTTEGRALQSRYGVQKTTLLLFDAKGNRMDTVVGLQTNEQLERLFAQRFSPST